MDRKGPRPLPTESPPAPGTGTARSLTSRAFRASGAILGGYGASQVLRLGSNVVLTRLLFPEAFGIMALIQVLQTGLEMISDIGIQPSIVQHKRGEDPAFLNTAWTLQAIRGSLLWICAVLLASPFAWFYREPQLAELIPVASASAILAGFNSTKLAVLSRRMTVGRIVLIDLSAQLTAIVVMVGIAVAYRSVWALVFGGLTSSSMKLLLSHLVISGPRHRFRWDSEASREIVRFGKWIFLSTLVTFIAMRLDIFILGRMVPMDLLGVYSIAGLLAVLPQQLTNRLTVAVLFPALAESARKNTQTLAANLRRARSILLPAATLCVLGIALLSRPFFYYLYDERYHNAGWMAQLMMISVWFQLLHLVNSRTALAIGDSRSLAIGNVIRLLFSVLGCLVGFKIGGLPGLILGVAVGSAAGYLSVMVAVVRHGFPVGRQDLAYTLVGGACGMVGVWAPDHLAAWIGAQDVSLVGAFVAAAILTPFGILLLQRARNLSGRAVDNGFLT